MNKLVSGAMGVEVQLRSGINRINFPDVVELRKKRIKHIDFCYGSYFGQYNYITKAPSGNDLVSDSVIDNLLVTLVESNTKTELIREIPASQLDTNGNRLFINKIVDLPRSYIDLTGISDPNDITAKSVYVVFWYDEPAIWSQINEANDRTAIQPVEITLTGSKTYFAENRDMLNKRIRNLLLSFPVVAPSGKSGLDVNYMNNKFLTLQRNGLQFFHQIPLYLFFQTNLNFQLRLQNIQFDFQNSYIETLSTSADDLKTVFFNAIIDDNPVSIKR